MKKVWENLGICSLILSMNPGLCDLYSPNEWTDFDETFHKSSTMNLLNTFFSDFENSNLMTSWRPLLLFSVPALSRSQFCSDFLQIWALDAKLFFTVCYLKSTKSVDNFSRYNGKKTNKILAVNKIFELGQQMYHFTLIQTR